MKSQYDSKTWAAETKVGRRIFNYNFRIKSADVKEWPLLKTVPMHRDAELVETSYLVQGDGDPERYLIRINTAELSEWRAAQRHLLEMLNHCMRPDIPRGTGNAAALGDISFVARASQSDIPGGIQFTRGNIAVAVNSVGAVIIDVTPVAIAVDQLLREPADKLASVRRLARDRTPQNVVTRLGQASILLPDLRDLGEAWLKAIVPDGEVRRRGNALVYTSRQKGKKAVQVYSIKR